MTPWHYRWLCQFAYIDLPENMPKHGQALCSAARELLSRDEKGTLACGGLSDSDRTALRVICQSEVLGQLEVIDFINRNSSTGFAAYVLRAPDQSIHCIFRGSEGRGCGVPTAIDWIDNFLAPFHGSVQYDDISALAARFSGKQVTFSGHSKGAHNALYALSVHGDERARAIVFNGQGFAPGQLNRSERAKLARSGINYVVRGDVVGVLLAHPERRVFVRREKGEHPHALSAFSFDERGEVRTALRPVWSLAVEWGTKCCIRAAGMP